MFKKSANKNDTNYSKEKKVYNKRNTFIVIMICVVVCVSSVSGFLGAFIYSKVVGNKVEGVTSTNIPVTTTKDTGGSMNISKVAKSCKPSVVAITATTVNEGFVFGESRQTSASGSGVIITTNGYIITNNHVVEDSSKIKVTLGDNKTTYSAKLIGTDEKTDIAVIKINAKNLSCATIGKSSTLEVGDSVLAIGNALGELSGTVTDGIVSATNREVNINNQVMELIQTNASINAGNSGGGLFDKNGLLVGIVNAKTSGNGVEGLGFAIPMDTAKNISEQLIDYGYVKNRVDSGITFLDILDEASAQKYGVDELGVYIYQVKDNSNAAKAGLLSGYIVKKVNGVSINSASQCNKIIEQLKAGDKVKITVKGNLSTKTYSFSLTNEKK